MRFRLPEAVRLLAFALLLLPLPALAAQDAGPAGGGPTGRVTGTVIDEYNAMTLPSATVRVVGSDTVVYTDLDGGFSIDLAPGTYDLRVSFSDYQDRVIEGVVIEAGDTATVDVALQLQGMAVEERVVVTATMEPELATQEAQLLERKRAGAIFDNLAAEEMKKSGDGDAAAAMSRVTGVSIVDNEYVYVRGLGERYSNTTLNGAILPTTEPDKRVVPLDLIPTGLIESIQLVKSYLPDRPAEFSGGLVQIESLNSPRQESWSVSMSQGFNEQSAFEDVLTYPGGGLDWLGFDDGTRSLPDVIPDRKLALSGIFTQRGFTREELEGFGEAFSNVWQPRSETNSIPDQGWSLSYGNDWGKLGTAFSVSYSLKDRFRTEDRTYFRVSETDDGVQELSVFSDYDFEIAEQKSRLGIVGNFSYEIDRNHRLTLDNFWTHNAADETRTFTGFNSDINTQLRNSRLYFIEEDIYTSKLSGEHLFPGVGNSRLDWRVNYSRATRNEPDLREVLYEFDPFRDAFVLADESQSGLRMFNDLSDEVWEGGFDWDVFFTSFNGLPGSIEFGPSVSQRARDFSSRRFRFKPINTVGVDLTRPAEELFTPENIGPVFLLQEETRPTDTYDAEHTILAAYAMLDLPLTRKLRLVGGARVEDSDQQVNTFDLFNPDRVPVSAELGNTDVLPGVNLVYQVASDMNLRGSFSRTVNRPEFRELSEFEFTDVVGGRAVVGNPDLKRATIDNYDLRWEWFPSPTEVIAVSGFYKDFTDPIERVIEPTAQLRTSFDNALGATNKGFEVELRKRLTTRFSVNLNYTWVDSQIRLEEQAGQVQTSLERPLAGQSDHVVNAQIGYDDVESGWQARALFNFFGERISDVGGVGQPDIVEEPRATVDLVLGKRWERLTLKVSAANLTDARYEFTQGDRTQRLYTTGREVGFSLSFDIH